METSERETIIRINDADMDEGWFSYYTSIKRVADMVKRLPSKSVLDSRIQVGADGKPTYWEFKLAKDLLCKAPFIRISRRAIASPEEKQRRVDGIAHLAKYRFKSTGRNGVEPSVAVYDEVEDWKTLEGRAIVTPEDMTASKLRGVGYENFDADNPLTSKLRGR